MKGRRKGAKRISQKIIVDQDIKHMEKLGRIQKRKE
jgi:hypothetical protein